MDSFVAIDSETRSCPEPGPALRWVTEHPGPWFALVWAPVLLLAPAIDSIAGADGHGFFLLLLAAVYALAVMLPFRRAARGNRDSEAAFILLLLVSTTALFLRPEDRNFVFPLLSIGAAAALRLRWAPSMVAATAISGSVTTGLERGSLDEAMMLGFATLLAGAATFLVRYLTEVIGELTRTRERLADAAVAQERLRFARDLHDLLGHSLSVIVVKAEAARRLADKDPAAAAGHVADIESLGRQALSEVRQVVGGYREPHVGQELAGAHTALAASDIQVDIAAAALNVDPAIDALLGWIVREGTTNVIRHSGASRCTITVSTQRHLVHLEIIDNGSGGTITEGNGLRGMRERAAALGGTLSTGPTDSGFRLAVTVPQQASEGRAR